MKNPLISIIVPVYKVEKYLDDCVKSILVQTYTNIEVLLVDDGSPDNCPAICDKYASYDKRIKSFHKSNGGLSDARNFGISHSTGDYLLFIDSDDLWLENTALEKLVAALNTQKSCDIIFFGRTTFINQTKFPSKPISPQLFTSNLTADLRSLLIHHEFIPSACQKLIKRDLIIENNIYFEKGLLSEDWEWCIRLYTYAHKIGGIEDNFYGYRKHEGSITQTFGIKHAQDILYIIEKSIKQVSESEMSFEMKEVFMGFLAYIYICTLGHIGQLPKKNREVLTNEYKRYASLLHHDINPKVKKVGKIYKIFGYKYTIKILGLFLSYRSKRI